MFSLFTQVVALLPLMHPLPRGGVATACRPLQVAMSEARSPLSKVLEKGSIALGGAAIWSIIFPVPVPASELLNFAKGLPLLAVASWPLLPCPNRRFKREQAEAEHNNILPAPLSVARLSASQAHTAQGEAARLERALREMEYEKDERTRIAKERKSGLAAAWQALDSARRWAAHAESELEASYVEPRARTLSVRAKRELHTSRSAADAELLAAAELVKLLKDKCEEDEARLLMMEALVDKTRVQEIVARVHVQEAQPSAFPRLAEEGGSAEPCSEEEA